MSSLGRQSMMEEGRVSVAPDADKFATGDELAYARWPLRPGKIQRPVLPDETLRRDRLLDWLESRTNRRVVLLVAEAGYGKTTLAADFARRSHLRTFWYRLDEEDTSALAFLRHVVLAIQAVDSVLLPRCSAMLTEAAISPTDPDTILRTLLWELNSLTGPPCALVLDDYHLVEAVPSIRLTVERLIARAPRHFRFIVISRRTPNLSVAALRARDDLAEIGRDELRFDAKEMRRRFAEWYHHPLESDVLCRLPAELRVFLLRTAILEEVDPETASVVVGVPVPTARVLVQDAERLGLLCRTEGALSSWRSHPLVRDY